MTIREHPILFSAPMVQGLLAGRKTQTRRIVKVPRGYSAPNAASSWTDFTTQADGTPTWLVRRTGDIKGESCKWMPCPYGQTGDHLWVRETCGRDGDGGYVYRADCSPFLNVELSNRADEFEHDCRNDEGWARWIPSIHMPRVASRITLEITDVRIERLHDITEQDAIAEGAPDYEEGIDAPPPDDSYQWSYIASFTRLWESINGKGSWAANPWVWAISFKRVEE